MKKVLRDGGIPGGAAAGIVLILTEQYNWAEGPAMVVGMAGAAVVAFGYRYIRHRWPWLMEFDPPGTSTD